MISRSFLAVTIALSLTLSLALIPTSGVASGYSPQEGDYFGYHEVQTLGNGTGTYSGYNEHTALDGMERMNTVTSGVVSANYSYTYAFNNGSSSTETGTQSGDYSFSSTSFLYVEGTDDQRGYVNPTVWFYMNSSLPDGGTFTLLNTQMTVESMNYSYYLPSLNKNVATIFAQGSSSYLRNDSYGVFTATYTWKSYFDPSTGYIVGYSYSEHDTNSSGTSFTYSDALYVTSTSYPLTTVAAASSSVTTSLPQTITSTGASSTSSPPPVSANNNPTQYLAYAAGIIILILIVAIVIYAISRRNRRTLPRHSPQEEGPTSSGGRGYPPTQSPPPSIDLTPKEQPPVQQVVIKEVAKVRCNYCGALIDSTARTCPQCGAPRN